jgi:type I restriction enzyme S subunit
MPLSTVVEDFQNGFASGERDNNGIIQLRMNNVNGIGQMIMNEYIRVPKKYYSSKYDIKEGDILFNHTNSAEMVGKSFVFKGYNEPVTFSNHFSRIRVNRSLVNPNFIVLYLVYLFNQRFFERFCDRWIHQAAFQKEKLLKLQVYFPNLVEQNYIVTTIETKLKAAEKAKQAANEQLKLTELLFDSYISKAYDKIKYRSVRLDEIVLINQTTKGKIPQDNNIDITFVPMAAVNAVKGEIANAETRSLGQVRKGYTYFENDDILFAKITPCMQNGKHAIAKNLKNGIGFGSTEFHVIKPMEDVIPEWIHFYLRRKSYLLDAENSMQGTVGQQRLPEDYLKETIIPLPPIFVQKTIVEKLKVKNKNIRKIIDNTIEQLSYIEALQTSILYQTFRENYERK